MMNRLLILLTICVSLYATGISATGTTSTTANTTTVSIESILTKPDPNSEVMYIPEITEGYVVQIDSLNPNTNTISFKAFSNADYKFLDNRVSYRNNNFAQAVSLSAEENQTVANVVSVREQQLADRSNGAVSQYYSTMQSYKQQLSTETNNATNTSSQKEFLSLSRFVVACLIFDNEVIDISQSLLLKQIVLQPKYTTDLQEALSVSQADIRNGNSITINKKMEYYIKKFSIKTFFFVLEWNIENNLIIQQIKMFLMGIFLPLTLGYVGFSKISRKLQNISDFDDWAEKGVILVGVFMFFFIPSVVHNGDNDKQLQQTKYQLWASEIVRKGVDFADDLTLGTVSAYTQWQINNLGVMSKDQLEQVYTASIKTRNTQELFTNIYTQECVRKYDLQRMYQIKSYMNNTDYTFFSDEEFEQSKETWKKDPNKKGKMYPFGNIQMLFQDQNTIPIMSLSACSQVEKDLRLLASTRENFEAFEQKMNSASNGVSIEEDVRLLTGMVKDGLNQAKHLGFLYAPYILLQDYFVRTTTSDSSPLSEETRSNKFSGFSANDEQIQKSAEKMLEEGFDIGSVGNILYSETKKMFTEILKILPYKIVPFFSTMQESIYKPTEIGMSALPELTPNPVKAGLDFGAYGFSNFIAYNIVDSTLKFAPAFLMIVAGVWAFIYYLISIFIYFMVSPYILAYALGSQQTEALRSFITRGVVLALKPIMMVMSIVIALVAIDLTIELLLFTEDVMMQNMIDNYTGAGWKFIMLTFFQGLFHIISLVITAIMAGVLVAKGADMIIAIFGLKEGNVDVKEIVSGDIGGKTDRYSNIT